MDYIYKTKAAFFIQVKLKKEVDELIIIKIHC